ncbi:MAG: hypothetical protein LBL63_03050, partial [Clostridiales Family XIII bacterium]|nr:hypothetical protein [Clostridiales Family XIII bacterium]
MNSKESKMGFRPKNKKWTSLMLVVALALTAIIPVNVLADDPLGLMAGTDPAPAEPAEAPVATEGEEGLTEPPVEEPPEEPVEEPSEDPIQEPAGAPGEQGSAVQAFGAITPMAAGDITVYTWSDLVKALDNSSYSRILVATTLTATSNPTISRPVEIDGIAGQNNTLNMQGHGFTLGSRSAAATFTLSNLKVTKTGSGHLVSASSSGSSNWTVNFNGVTSTSAATSPLVSLANSVVNFTGTNNWTIPGTYTIISQTRHINFTGGKTTLKGGNTIIESSLSDSSIDAKAGADVTIYSTGTGNVETVYLHPSSGSAAVIATDGASLDISGWGYGSDSSGGTVCLVAPSGGFTIERGGKITVKSLLGSAGGTDGQPALVQQVSSGRFNVSGKGSELNLISYGNHNQYGATIRFRAVGDQRFNVDDGAVVNITKAARSGGRDAAAIRFGTGRGNEFHVKGGAQVYVTNFGNGAYADATNSD